MKQLMNSKANGGGGHTPNSSKRKVHFRRKELNQMVKLTGQMPKGFLSDWTIASLCH